MPEKDLKRFAKLKDSLSGSNPNTTNSGASPQPPSLSSASLLVCAMSQRPLRDFVVLWKQVFMNREWLDSLQADGLRRYYTYITCCQQRASLRKTYNASKLHPDLSVLSQEMKRSGQCKLYQHKVRL